MKKDPLYEVIFDISINLDRHLNNLDEGERTDIFDALEGSRGICHSLVIPWAHEFEKTWTDRGDEDIDYIIAVDDFTRDKFAALRKQYENKVVGLQVVPTIALLQGSVEPQFAGPDHNTTNWSVYERLADDTTRWVADFALSGEELAMRFAVMHAAALGVKIEPQRWKSVATTSFVEQAAVVTKTFPFRVEWVIDVDAPTPRDAAVAARRSQLNPDSTATIYSVRRTDKSNKPAVSIDLSENPDD